MLPFLIILANKFVSSRKDIEIWPLHKIYLDVVFLTSSGPIGRTFLHFDRGKFFVVILLNYLFELRPVQT
jgi:hypothetical protein